MTYRELIDLLNFYAGGNPERLDCVARIELKDGELHEILGFRIDAESPNPHPSLYIDVES